MVTETEVDRMSRIRVSTNALALLACSALLLASFGCSSDGILAPKLESADAGGTPNFVRILSTSGDVVFDMSAEPVSTVISAANGGTLSNGRVTLEFPANALSEDTEISIDMLNDGTLSVELSPHGIQFNHPVLLTMDLSGTDAEGNASSVTTYWFNEASNSYEEMPMVGTDSNLTHCLLEHFSRYSEGVKP